MSDREILLEAILREPGDDTPRLALADWRERHGEIERGEFIRVQCELAKKPQCKSTVGYPPSYICDRAESWDCKRCLYMKREPDLRHIEACHLVRIGLPSHIADSAGYERGFISSLTLSWSDWLAHHTVLYWHPKQRVECPGKLRIVASEDEYGKIEVSSGPASIPRPFVATSQPLELVRLTDMPPALAESNLRHYSPVVEVDSMGPEGRMKWGRVKCRRCDGRGHMSNDDIVHRRATCPDCRGVPLNRWTCDKWPGLEFVMPRHQTAER